jgi:hypothetical protein
VRAVSGGCPASLAACLCRMGEGHPGPHRCTCDGSWNEDGSIVSFPLGDTDPLVAMARLMGIDLDEEDE